jgi:hypothetical protein
LSLPSNACTNLARQLNGMRRAGTWVARASRKILPEWHIRVTPSLGAVRSVPSEQHKHQPEGQQMAVHDGDMDGANLDAMLARFAEHWSPKKIAQVNDYDVRIVKLQGEFTWHRRFGSVSRDDRHDR